MRFILMPGCIDQFDELRKDYEIERKIDLDKTLSLVHLPTVFGGTDVTNRRKQIAFLEKMKSILSPYLYKEENIKTSQEWQANLMASRIMIAACLYIKTQIPSPKANSALYRLINRYLNITSINYLDESDKESCYQTAFELVKQLDVFSHLNSELKSLDKDEFSESEWKGFSSFILKQDIEKNAPKVAPNNYPVTTVMKPVFEAAFSYVGCTVGWVVGEAINNSTLALGPKYQLTSTVGSVLLILGTTGPTGVALLAPTIAAKLMSAFCKISLARMSGSAMGFVGKGAGIAVGLPFDLVYNLLKATGALIITYSTPNPDRPDITGIRIADGVVVIRGNPMQINLVPKSLSPMQKLIITHHGTILLDGHAVADPNNQMAQVVTKLNENYSTVSKKIVEEVEEENRQHI